MSWTYTTLKQALQDYVETDETTFVSNIPIFVQQAEDRILKNVQLPNFRKSLSAALTASSEYYTLPSDFLSSYSFAVDSSGFKFLVFKKVSFIREAYPDSSVEGIPKYYGLFDNTKFIVAPTPSSNLTIELNYFYKPESIVTAKTSWLGTHAESSLFYGSLLEAYVFTKGDPDEVQTAEKGFASALGALKILAEGRNQTDEYRHG